ncbi:hypothetical protein CYMTET_40283 [Cymbomonas tetramitiformis]|uniref:Uncharacterized protein n=1 Tax=Cymbomonas tetramitiformis TaxID=36881 RepID=A0AAE0C8E8_9CHLO|nr:hypothetical protein CYMTET_40283 [Cymbomonas tetramitiformis]
MNRLKETQYPCAGSAVAEALQWLIEAEGLRQHRGGGGGCVWRDRCVVSDFPSLMAPKRMRGLFTECVMAALERMRVNPEDIEAYELLSRWELQPIPRGMQKGVAQIIKEQGIRGDPEGRGRRRELQEQALELDGKALDEVECNVPQDLGPGSSSGVGRICGRFMSLNKLGVNIHPIARGEHLQRPRAMAVSSRGRLSVGGGEMTSTVGCGRPRFGWRYKGGVDLGVHTVHAALLDQHPEWFTADAKNAFNAEMRGPRGAGCGPRKPAGAPSGTVTQEPGDLGSEGDVTPPPGKMERGESLERSAKNLLERSAENLWNGARRIFGMERGESLERAWRIFGTERGESLERVENVCFGAGHGESIF